MSLARSSASWKSGDGVSDQFPAGMRVLVVDDDSTCLRILEKMLTTYLYEVTKCSRAEVALKMLRDNKDGFDIVISEVHMPDMDGFKLLEHIGLEMDLPLIMMSAEDSKKVVMKGITHGACDYLIKPVHMEELKNIWQHVVRRKRHEWENKQLANEGSWESSKKRKDDSGTSKKTRVIWSLELHQQFVYALNQLGIDKAVPKKILELMNVPGLTRENVASHLQKYRLYLRRIHGQQQRGLGNSFIGHHDPAFGDMNMPLLHSQLSQNKPLQMQMLLQQPQPRSQFLNTNNKQPSALLWLGILFLLLVSLLFVFLWGFASIDGVEARVLHLCEVEGTPYSRALRFVCL